jgi:hypothetical protein
MQQPMVLDGDPDRRPSHSSRQPCIQQLRHHTTASAETSAGHMRPSEATWRVVRRSTCTGPAAFGLPNSKRRRT